MMSEQVGLKACPWCKQQPRHAKTGQVFCRTTTCPIYRVGMTPAQWNRRACPDCERLAGDIMVTLHRSTCPPETLEAVERCIAAHDASKGDT